jgi:hypothetical protein
MGIWWYVAYPISYRRLEEMMVAYPPVQLLLLNRGGTCGGRPMSRRGSRRSASSRSRIRRRAVCASLLANWPA